MIAGAHPVLTCAQARAWEEKVLGGDEAATWSAMTRAGEAVAAAVLRDAEERGGIPENARILALCGKGHNGGDALIALDALLTARAQATATILLVPGLAALRPLVRRAFENLWRRHSPRIRCRGISGGSAGADAGWFERHVRPEAFDLCLDGLLGMQFHPPLRDPFSWLIDGLNAHPSIGVRVAIDLPSGVGDAADPRAFRADFTCATGIAKAPLFDPANRDAVGRVRYLDIGFFGEHVPGEVPDTAEFVLTERVLDPLRGLRPSAVDKRTYGHLFVVSGSRTLPGAVLMAVEAALVSGVGLVTAFVPDSLAAAFAARLPEAMWVPLPETLDGGLALEGRGAVVARAARCTGLLAGPGLGRERESLTLIAELLRAIDVPAVLDGDALQPEVVAARYPGSTPIRVLTPHAGEYARIAAGSAGDNDGLRSTATRLGATVVLKGAPTRVSDGHAVAWCPCGGPVLSRGGSGDVLAGLIAGQLAQGLSPVEAAARGVVWHGCAADRLAQAHGQVATRVTELVPLLADVLRARDGQDAGAGATRSHVGNGNDAVGAADRGEAGA